MPSGRPLAEVFDDVAEDYDRHRQGYPADLIGTTAERRGLIRGSCVLEIGCGTGLLTEVLVGLGFSIEAVDPGANMIEQAKRRLGATDAVTFRIGRFEDTDLPEGVYDAVFSATAFHWVDPVVGWGKAASLLKQDGLLALVTHVGISNEDSERVWAEFWKLLQTYVPGHKPWPPPRTLDALLMGAKEREGNASSVWDWVMGEGRHELTRAEVARLFDEVETAAVVRETDLTADDLIAFVRTTSHYAEIDPTQRDAFEDEDRRLIEANGGVVHSSSATVLMTARRSS